jgi:type I restriction enzyme R subunit
MCNTPPTPVLQVSEPGSDADRSAEFRDLRERLAADLRNEIAGMSLDNFLVRPKRRSVEKYAAVAAWSRLDADAQQELVQVAGLPSAAADGDLAAKQFDLIVFRAELALLQVDAAYASRRARITEIASLLEALRRPYSGL